MHPILFEIPGLNFPVRSFGVMVVAGFLIGTFLFNRLVARHTDDPAAQAEGFASLPIWVLVGVLAGARLMYVIVEILRGGEVGQSFLADPLKIFAYWEGGLVMYGGTFGGAAAGLWCAMRHRLNPWNALDMGMAAAFLGLALGRIGCVLVGDDFGQIVPAAHESLPFPITLKVPDPLPEESLFGLANAGQTLYATQLWMSFNALMLSILGVLFLRLRRYPGQASLWLMLLYSVGRGTIEHFRGDDVRGVWFDGAVSTSQVISIGLAFVCLGLLIKLRGRRTPIPGQGQPVAA